MQELPIVSEKTRRMHEELNEGIVRTNQNLNIILVFANGFPGKSITEHAQALRADPDKVLEAAKTMQGYGYIYIDIRDGKNILVATPKGEALLRKNRENHKKRQ